MIYIDKYAYFSKLGHISPEIKMLFGVLGLIGSICSNTPAVFAFVFLVMLTATVVKAKIPFSYFLKLMLLPAGFLILSVFGIMVSISKAPLTGDVIWSAHLGFYFSITKSGLALAFSLTGKSLAAVSCLYFIILTTPVRDIITVLRKCKCPALLITLITLVYRFTFLLMETCVTKINSQHIRHGYDKPKDFTRVFGMLWGSVFIQSVINSEWIYKAMLVRGYEGELRFLPKETRVKAADVLALTSFAAVIILLNIINY